MSTVESAAEVPLGKRGRWQGRNAVRRQEKTDLEEMLMQKDVVMKGEQFCKMEEEEVEVGTGGSIDMSASEEGCAKTLRQDSYEYEDNSTMESKSKQEDSGKEDGVVVKSYQPLLLHRAPR